jgi:hypothetical protein
MDRYTVNIAKSQIGFIDFIVKPTWEVVVMMLPAVEIYQHYLDANRKNW